MKPRFKFFIVIFWLVLAGLGLMRSNLLTVREIRCFFNGETCSALLWEDLMNLSLGKSLVFFPKNIIIQQIKSGYPEIEKIEIGRALPLGLVFKLTASEAQASIKGEKYFLVNSQGMVLKISDSPGALPVILLETLNKMGVAEKFDQKEVIFTIKILSELGIRGLYPTMGKIISPSQVNVWLRDGALAIISLKKEPGPQLDSLQLILSRVKIEGKRLKQLDLRFDKPIITYE